MTVAIWWIRRDLRLRDNQALQSALAHAETVLPVFVLDPKLLNSPYVSQKRLSFLYQGLLELNNQLIQRGSTLILRQGDPLIELGKLTNEANAHIIFAEPDFSPYASKRDKRAEGAFNICWCGSPAILPPGSVLKSDGNPYTLFTPFSKAWRSMLSQPLGMNFRTPEIIPTPSHLISIENRAMLENYPSISFQSGEMEANRLLSRFLEGDGFFQRGSHGIFDYFVNRNRLDLEATSQLSPYLKFGMLSARAVASAVLEAITTAPDDDSLKSAESWLNELIWRDFYIHILYHFPNVRKGNFRLPNVRWENEIYKFDAWKAGITGYPVVDAAMRQLQQTGWMHNRARMVVASFLTKDLLIDWRWGEKWFMQNLIDGDPASNNGGWQWSAGTGTDAAPYFRILNPISQGKKHDPHGSFIRQWLPELVDLPDDFIHQPWTMPVDMQRSSGVLIGKTYPAPIVDHLKAKQSALRAYGHNR
jgi:deoxyribodipyrimidine photo-lyase